ncbi:MAG: hypothetical protein ABI128_00500 [Rhodanobacter sp.]
MFFPLAVGATCKKIGYLRPRYRMQQQQADHQPGGAPDALKQGENGQTPERRKDHAKAIIESDDGMDESSGHGYPFDHAAMARDLFSGLWQRAAQHSTAPCQSSNPDIRRVCA